MVEPATLRRIEWEAAAALAPLAVPSAAERRAALFALRPEPGDYAPLFAPHAVLPARRAYQAWWAAPDLPEPKPGQTSVLITAAVAADLVRGVGDGAAFAGGWRRLGDVLRPDGVWLRFVFLRPGESAGTAYEGLAAVGGRFVWFPKPWRMLAGVPRPFS